jgi:hypothetical protein
MAALEAAKQDVESSLSQSIDRTKILDTALTKSQEDRRSEALQAERAQAAFKQQLASANEAHAKTLLKAEQLAADERKRIMLQLSDERVASEKKLEEVREELKATRSRLDAAQAENVKAALSMATASAELSGTRLLLENERRHHASAIDELKARYETDEFRNASLIKFLMAFRAHGGRVVTPGSVQTSDDLARWLRDEVSIGDATAKVVSASFEYAPEIPS